MNLRSSPLRRKPLLCLALALGGLHSFTRPLFAAERDIQPPSAGSGIVLRLSRELSVGTVPASNSHAGTSGRPLVVPEGAAVSVPLGLRMVRFVGKAAPSVGMGGDFMFAALSVDAGHQGMSLFEAVQASVARHPDISRAKAAIEQSKSEIAVAESAVYPTVDYGVQPGYGGGYGSSGYSVGLRTNIGVNQLLYDFGRTNSRISAAEAASSKNTHLLDDTVEKVGFDAASTFVELALSQALIAAAEQQVAAQEKIRVRIQDRVKAGFSDLSDQKQADMAILRAQALILKARTRYSVAAGRMAELAGSAPPLVASLEDTRAVLSRIKADDDSIDHTPAVLAAQAEVEEAAARVRQTEAERYPAISVGIMRTDTTGMVSAGDSTWVGLSLKGNFSVSGQSKHQIAAAQAQQRAAMETLQSQKLTGRMVLDAARREAAGAWTRMQSHGQAIELAEASRDLYWKEYVLNKRMLTEVLNTEREIYLSHEDRLNALADGILAYIKAYATLGRFVPLLQQAEESLL